MKKIIIILISTFCLFSCKKANTEAKVNITITNGTGVKQSNVTVYQINDTKWNLYGADPFFKDAQSVTSSDGVASFTLDDLTFAVSDQATVYYFTEYTIAGVDKTKNVGITIKKGETKSATLVLN